MLKEDEGDYEKMTKKNRNKRSIVAILMAAVVTFVSLVGCKGESDNTVVIQEGETPAV